MKKQYYFLKTVELLLMSMPIAIAKIKISKKNLLKEMKE